MIIPEGENIIDVTYKIFIFVIKPALEQLKDYGNCSEIQKREFIYGIDSFIKFIKSKKKNLNFTTLKILFQNFC